VESDLTKPMGARAVPLPEAPEVTLLVLIQQEVPVVVVEAEDRLATVLLVVPAALDSSRLLFRLTLKTILLRYRVLYKDREAAEEVAEDIPEPTQPL
jgi:hypothetical protein